MVSKKITTLGKVGKGVSQRYKYVEFPGTAKKWRAEIGDREVGGWQQV